MSCQSQHVNMYAKSLFLLLMFSTEEFTLKSRPLNSLCVGLMFANVLLTSQGSDGPQGLSGPKGIRVSSLLLLPHHYVMIIVFYFAFFF